MSADPSVIDLRPHDAALVRLILKSHAPRIEARIFGSRATGKAKPYSDLDIALMSDQPLSFSTLASLEYAFEESDLPFKIDIVDIASVSPAFRAIIERTAIVFPTE